MEKPLFEKPLFIKFEEMFFEPNLKGDLPLKSAVLFALETNTNEFKPLLYCSKPKNVSQHDYQQMLFFMQKIFHSMSREIKTWHSERAKEQSKK